jgi:hypothetical protein
VSPTRSRSAGSRCRACDSTDAHLAGGDSTMAGSQRSRAEPAADWGWGGSASAAGQTASRGPAHTGRRRTRWRRRSSGCPGAPRHARAVHHHLAHGSHLRCRGELGGRAELAAEADLVDVARASGEATRSRPAETDQEHRRGERADRYRREQTRHRSTSAGQADIASSRIHDRICGSHHVATARW